MTITKDQWEELKRDILDRFDAHSFLDEHFPVVRRMSGKLGVNCCFHDDKTPSLMVNPETNEAYCHSCGRDGPANMIDVYMQIKGMNFTEARNEMADTVGLELPGGDGFKDNKSKPKPKRTNTKKKESHEERPFVPEELVESWHKALKSSPNLMKTIIERRGISERSVDRYKIGWDADSCLRAKPRFTLPIRDAEGNVVNVRRYDPRLKNAKMISLCCTKGWKIVRSDDKECALSFGSPARLFGTDEIAMKGNRGKVVHAFEGEWDKVKATDEDGDLLAVSGTGGCKMWLEEWSKAMSGMSLVTIYDADREGQDAAKSKVEPSALRYAATYRNVKLLFGEGKTGKDISDWLGYGHTMTELKELVEAAEVKHRESEIDFEVEKMTIYRTSPRIYEMRIEGNVIELSTAELGSPAKFRLKFIDHVERVPKMPGRKAEKSWDDWVNEWMESAERIDMPEEASLKGALRQTVKDVILAMPIGNEAKELNRGKMVEKDGLGLFKLEPLSKAVQETWPDTTQPALCKILRTMGCWPTKKRRMGAIEVRLWALSDTLLESKKMIHSEVEWGSKGETN